MKNRRKLQAGFTLIELVMVIVILGILAAVALPKFADVSSDARKAAAKGMSGNVLSAANNIKSIWVAKGAAGQAAPGSVAIENGGTVTVDTTTGYPTAAVAGIDAAVTVSGGWAANAGVFTDGTCTVTYTLVNKVPNVAITPAGTCI